MATVTYGLTISGGGIGISQSIQRTADGIVAGGPYTIPVSIAGQLTTRTNDTDGVITSASHGIVNATNLDIWWSAGVRYGALVIASDTNTLTVNSGAGDALPDNATNLTFQNPTVINLSIDGDECNFFAQNIAFSTDTTAKASVNFLNSANATVKQIDLDANTPFVLDIDGGATNQLTGDPIAHAHVSIDSTSEAGTLNIIALYDST